MTEDELTTIEFILSGLTYRDDPELYELAQHVPTLIAELRRLRAELAEAEAELQNLREETT